MIESYVGARRRRATSRTPSPKSCVGDGATLTHLKLQRESARGVPRRHDRGDAGARQPLRVVLVRDRRGAVAHERLHRAARRGLRRDAQRAVHAATASSTSTTRRASSTWSRTATAASCTRACSTARRTACSTARCTCIPRRRRPTASRRTTRCCSPSSAQIDTKPQLEIFADDVKCTHGATVGRHRRDGAVLHEEPRHRRAHGARSCSRTRSRPTCSRRSSSAEVREGLEARDAARATPSRARSASAHVRPRRSSTSRSSSTTTGGRRTTARWRARTIAPTGGTRAAATR